jgi:hypothetical protein
MKTKPALYIFGLALIMSLYAFGMVYPSLTQEADFYLLSRFNPMSADKIEISYHDQNITLEKKNQVWTITSPFIYKAQGDMIEEIVQSLSDLKSSSIASSEEKDHPAYELSGSSATVVKIFDIASKSLAEITVGKAGSNLNYAYVLTKDDPTIYYAKISGYNNLKFPSINSFRDPKIFTSLDPQDIQKIENTLTGFTLVYSQGTGTGTVWTDEAGIELDSVKVNEYLGAIFSTYAMDFTDGKNLKFDETKYIKFHTSSGGGGADLTIIPLEKDGQVYLKTNLNNIIFVINHYYYEQMLRKPI